MSHDLTQLTKLLHTMRALLNNKSVFLEPQTYVSILSSTCTLVIRYDNDFKELYLKLHSYHRTSTTRLSLSLYVGLNKNKNRFFPHTISERNRLPQPIDMSHSVEIFKTVVSSIKFLLTYEACK